MLNSISASADLLIALPAGPSKDDIIGALNTV